MRKFPRFLGGMVLRLLVCILIGVVLMTAVYCIPTEPMADNMYYSAETLYYEGLCPTVSPWSSSMLDNFTDSFMLLHAVYRNDEPAWVQGMNVYRPYFDIKDQPYVDLVDHYIHGKEYINEYTYERYWHGYLVYLKPLLYLTTYGTMRRMNTLGQILTMVLVAVLLAKRGKKSLIVPYLLSMGTLNLQVTTQCLQLSSCFYAMNFCCIAMLLMKRLDDRKASLLFFYTGIFTAFLDFLTYPLAVLTVPAVLYFSLREGGNWFEDLTRLVGLCFCWGFGYLGMWGGKWVVSGLITGTSQLSGILNKFQERTTGTVFGEEVGLQKAWSENWTYFWESPFSWLVWAAMLVLAALVLRKLVKGGLTSVQLQQALPFVLLAAAPFVWYGVAQNHSIMHAMVFTYRSLVVLPFALMCFAVKVLETGTENRKGEQRNYEQNIARP